MSGHLTEAISFYKEASEVLEEMGDSKRAFDALEKAAAIRKMLQDATAADSIYRGGHSRRESLMCFGVV